MAIAEIELGVSDLEREIRSTVHRFAEEVLRPAGASLDRLADPHDVIATDSLLWTVFDRYRELGLAALDADRELDPVVKARTAAAVYEEFGWGDSGLAISLAVSDFHRMLVNMLPAPALVERFLAPDSKEIGCWAITEPDHGSDTLAVTEPAFRDPAVRGNCVARIEGNEVVIRGQKSAWVSNGTIADVAVLFCSMDERRGLQGGAVVLVPLDLPGVSRGVPLDKLGQRALNQGEIVFEDVRVPRDYLLVEPDGYPVALEMVLTLANAIMGCVFSGVARAAYELAVDYARERVQGGVPIIEHQSVRSRLFKMFTQSEAAASLARQVYVYNRTQAPRVHYSIASKVFGTTTAFEVASGAVQIFGGNGLSREYPVEKLLRDARASMIEDGCNEVLSIVGGARL